MSYLDHDALAENRSQKPVALSAEDQAWSDAYRIAYVGASNPVAAAGALARDSAALMSEMHDTKAVREHHALQAIAAHVVFLFGGDPMGPSREILQEVEENAVRLGIWTADA